MYTLLNILEFNYLNHCIGTLCHYSRNTRNNQRIRKRLRITRMQVQKKIILLFCGIKNSSFFLATWKYYRCGKIEFFFRVWDLPPHPAVHQVRLVMIGSRLSLGPGVWMSFGRFVVHTAPSPPHPCWGNDFGKNTWECPLCLCVHLGLTRWWDHRYRWCPKRLPSVRLLLSESAPKKTCPTAVILLNLTINQAIKTVNLHFLEDKDN